MNGDHDGDGYLVALDRQTGKTLWKVDRPNKTRSYCAPVIRELAGKTQMILSGTKCVASYDPNDGRLIWMIDGPTEQFVASLVYNDRAGLLFMTGGFPEHHILAIKPDGTVVPAAEQTASIAPAALAPETQASDPAHSAWVSARWNPHGMSRSISGSTSKTASYAGRSTRTRTSRMSCSASTAICCRG